MTFSKLNIGIVSTDGSPFIGGMGRSVGALAAGLGAAGISVSVFDRSRRPLVYLLLKNIGFSIGLGAILKKWIQKQGINVLHVHAGPGGVFLTQSFGIPIVVTAHHTYGQQVTVPGQWWKRILIPWERATYKNAIRVICASADTAASLERDYGIARAKISVIPWGFDLSNWIAADQPDEKRERLSCVFAGRPDKRKGWDILLAAWPIVREKFPDAILHVVGFGGRNRDGIVFHGRVPDTELQSLIGRSRFLVCPSRLEGFGLTAAEAIAAETPVVGTNVQGLRLVVRHNESGILVSPDAAAIADAMIQFFTDDALWKKLRIGCQAARTVFDPASSLRAHADLFRAVYSSPI